MTSRPEPPTSSVGVSPWLREALRCPVSSSVLVEQTDESGGTVLVSHEAGLVYPVRDGVPILLAHEAVPLD